MPTSRKMHRLIARSSLGSPAARSLRARTPRHVTNRVVNASTIASRSRGSSKTTPYKSS